MAMTGLTLTAVAHQWLFDPARVAASVLGKRTDHAVVDDLERVVEARRRLDDALGGGSLLPATREHLRLVVALLRNSSYTEEVGRRLYAVAAEFGRLARCWPMTRTSTLSRIATSWRRCGLPT